MTEKGQTAGEDAPVAGGELKRNATREEALAFGKSLRSRAGRSEAGRFAPGSRDPIGIIEDQNRNRLQDLVPVRIGRMLESPFAYYRGTAGPMAADLAGEPRSGLLVTGCGDAHIANFGLFAAPDRRIIFDMNDFDEAGPCPWEWDVKRMACSIELAARDRGFSSEQTGAAVLSALRSYREAMSALANMSAIDRFYSRVEMESLIAGARTKRGRKALEKGIKKASKKTSERVLEKITVETESGQRKIIAQPPILQPIEGLDEMVERGFRRYLGTVQADRALLLSQFRLVDYALRVVGVGSVGTRCFILLLLSPKGAPLFLQLKEAGPSVLETYGGIAPRPLVGLGDRDSAMAGYRVVSSQQVLQAASDPFLGWVRGDAGVDYYVRQFRDMKGSADFSTMEAGQLENYGALCGGLLARGHSQSPGAIGIAAYLGKSDRFDRAVAKWSRAYADQTEKDFEAFEEAAERGRFPVERGV